MSEIEDIAELLDDELRAKVAAKAPQQPEEFTLKEFIESTGLREKTGYTMLQSRVKAGTMKRRKLGKSYLYSKA